MSERSGSLSHALASLALALVALPAGAQGPPQPPPVHSPELGTDGSVTFRLRAPEAESVLLMGSDVPDNPRGKPLAKDAEGIWELRLESLEPGSYRYHFGVDGVRVTDPVNTSTSESNGNVWSLVHLPGADIMDTRDVPHGAVAEVTYYSAPLERFRRMHVYTPPGYESGQKRYPLFYLLHGAFDCDDSWTTVGRAGFILDNLIAAGKAEPMVVVMPAGHTGPFAMGRPGGDLFGEFRRDFLEAVVPYAESHYRLLEGRQHRALAGLSMGGGQTLDIGLPNLGAFGYLGVFSSGVFGITGEGFGAERGLNWEKDNAALLDDAETRKGLKLFWFATGRDDFLIETSRKTVEVFRAHGFEVAYEETAGGHTWDNWREYLNAFAPRLFK
jgi:enterochelin esterase family protein